MILVPVYFDKNAKEGKQYYYQFYTGEIINGVRKRIKKTGFKTEKLATRAEAKAMTMYFEGGYIEPSKMQFSQYIKEWLRTKRNISQETEELYHYFFKKHIIPSLGHIQLSKITAHHIELFITDLHNAKLAKSTIRRIFSVANAALNAAAKKDLINSNPCNKIEKPKAQQHRDLIIWEPGFVGKFLHSTRNKSRHWIAAYLAIMTGMRQGEILGIRWSDIDFENKTINIQQTVTSKRRIKPGAKNKSSIRSVAISSETIRELKDHRELIISERLKEGENYLKNDLVVCTSFGGPVTSRNIQKAWVRFIEITKAPKITFHDLRHTHAALMIKQGVHIKVVSERLGHSTVAITMDLYGHLMQNMQQDAAEALDSMINTRLHIVK
jgi:integrase